MKAKKTFSIAILNLMLISLISHQAFVAAAAPDGLAGYDQSTSLIAQGIDRLEIAGTPGLLTVFGADAFTVLTDARGRSLIAGAAYGQGRIAVLTHGDWLGEKCLSDPQNRLFLENLIAWTVNGRRRLKALAVMTDLEPLSRRIKDMKAVKTNQLPPDLKGYDLVAIDFTHGDASAIDEGMLAALKDYVAGGGAVICYALGWVYNHYGDGKKGKSLEKDFIGNRFLKDFGVLCNGEFTGNKILLSQSVGNKHHPLLLVEKVDKLITAQARLPEEELNLLLTVMLAYKEKLPHNEKYLRIFERHYDSFGRRRDISAGYPVGKTEQDFLLTIGMLNLLYSCAPYERISELRDAAFFPGEVGPGAMTTETDFPCDLFRNRWQSTGLYAPAGRPVSFTVAPGEGNMVKVRIGAHADVLFPLDDKYRKQLKRWPDISLTRALKGGETLIVSPHGGLIYFERMGNPDRHTLNIRINGAVAAPYFKLEETDVREWRERIRYYQAPWGELAGRRIILTFSAATLKKIDDPEKLLRYWDKAVGFYHELQQEPPKDYEERFVHDVQPKIGWLHAGYPIVINSEVGDYTAGLAVNPADKTSLYDTGSWGHFHELGHNCQRGEWTFDGAVEVTVNLFTLYAMEKMHGIIPAEHPWHREGWGKLKKYVVKGAPFGEWKKDPQLALTTYIILQKEFGWEAFKKVFAAYRLLPAGERPKTDQEKMDLWLVMFSTVVKKDLGPYFRKVGIPVSPGALAKIMAYPVWMPAGL